MLSEVEEMSECIPVSGTRGEGRTEDFSSRTSQLLARICKARERITDNCHGLLDVFVGLWGGMDLVSFQLPNPAYSHAVIDVKRVIDRFY